MGNETDANHWHSWIRRPEWIVPLFFARHFFIRLQIENLQQSARPFLFLLPHYIPPKNDKNKENQIEKSPQSQTVETGLISTVDGFLIVDNDLDISHSSRHQGIVMRNFVPIGPRLYNTTPY